MSRVANPTPQGKAVSSYLLGDVRGPQFAAGNVELDNEVVESAKKIYSAEVSADVVVVTGNIYFGEG